MEDTYGLRTVKIPAGHMVLYPRNEPTSGAAGPHAARGSGRFLWIQSMVRDDTRRSLLFDLDLGIQKLNRDLPDHRCAIQFTGVYHNLLRQWAEL